MKCKDCRFSLPCFAGRLDGDDAELELCVRCGNLGVTRHGESGFIAIYSFKCEQRPLTSDMYTRWCKRVEDSTNNGRTTRAHIAEMTWSDPVGTISKRLRLRECSACNPNAQLISTMRSTNIQVTYHFLDKEEAEKKELESHAWSLTPTRTHTSKEGDHG